MEKSKRSSFLLIPFLITLVFCAFTSRALFYYWFTFHLEKWSPLLFLIWLSPVIFYQVNTWRLSQEYRWNAWGIYLALIFTLIGIFGSLNTACYFGLACLFLSLLPFHFGWVIWLLASVSWMPVIGWIGLWYFDEYITLVRFSLAIIPSIVGIYYLGKRA